MKIIPFVAVAASSLPNTLSFVKTSEDVQTRVERLVFSLSADNALMFEDGAQIIQLREGGWFVKPEGQSHWHYHPELFKPREFEICNPQWNANLQHMFEVYCMPTVWTVNA